MAGICKACGGTIDVIIGNGDVPQGHVPSPSDFAICNSCGVIGNFDKDMNIVECNDDDLDKLMDENPEMYIQMYSASILIKKIAAMRKGKM